jgi:cytochrome c oxidase subunit I
VMISGFLTASGAANFGWFSYAPLSGATYAPGAGPDLWIVGVIVTSTATVLGAVNLVTTIFMLRAPGMTMFRMPIFTWNMLVTSVMVLLAFPVLTSALAMLFADRHLDAHIFEVQKGGTPVLWQHLFWFFGHPEVYIVALPFFGVVTDILPVFSRRPVFGYRTLIFATLAIGGLSVGVWAHHMFATGLGPVAISAFSLSTMFIAVPTGVKIFNWIGTMWGGRIRVSTPLLFAAGFVAMFTIGGLSGVTHAIVPSDTQQTDTYYIVAHFHYVLFGGSIFGLFAGIYYWYPKFTNKLLDERLGKLHFVLMLIGFNLTFGPFHILGLQGMPRRIYTYPANRGWDFWNFVSTIGAFTIALSILVFLINVRRTRRTEQDVGADPWDARTLEWSIPSPPPDYNFASVPVVAARDELWHREYGEDDEGRPVRRELDYPVVESLEDGEGKHIHMPSPSYWPLVASLALPVICYALIYRVWAVAILGGFWLIGAIYSWALEPQTAPPEDDDDALEPPALGSGDDGQPVPALEQASD